MFLERYIVIMTTQEFAEFAKLKNAIAALEQRRDEISTSATSATHELTGMPGAKGKVSDIVGNSGAMLAEIERMIAQKKWEMEAKRDAIVMYIASVSDETVFTAMTLHYVDGLTWNVAAQRMRGNTADSLRMAVKRYVNDNP